MLCVCVCVCVCAGGQIGRVGAINLSLAYRPLELCLDLMNSTMQHLEIETFAMDAVNGWDFGLFPPGEDECMGKTKKESKLVPEAKTKTESS